MMKVKNIKEPAKFFEVLQDCKGQIELVTSQGDRLNLKSKLCQYITLTQVFRDAEIKDIEIMFSEPEDINKVLQFLVKG